MHHNFLTERHVGLTGTFFIISPPDYYYRMIDENHKCLTSVCHRGSAAGLLNVITLCLGLSACEELAELDKSNIA